MVRESEAFESTSQVQRESAVSKLPGTSSDDQIAALEKLVQSSEQAVPEEQGTPQPAAQPTAQPTDQGSGYFSETSSPQSTFLENVRPIEISSSTPTIATMAQPSDIAREVREETSSSPTERAESASTITDSAMEMMSYTPTGSFGLVKRGEFAGVEAPNPDTGELETNYHEPRMFSEMPRAYERRDYSDSGDFKPENVGTPVGARSTPYDIIGLDSKREKWAASEKLREALGFRDFDVVGQPVDASPSSLNKAFRGSIELKRDRINYSVQLRMDSGNSFYDIMHPQDDLGMHEVSLGSDDLLAAITQPDSTLLEELNKLLEQARLETLTVEDCVSNIDLLIDAINSPQINYEVTMMKYPTNKGSSVNRRTLRIRPGRGIGLHPTQAKMYNADFDGDEGLVVADNEVSRQYNHALDYLIDVDGNPTIDPDYFPLDPVDPRERNQILEAMRAFFNRSGRHSELAHLADQLVDSYIDVCNNPDSEHWKKFIKKMDEVAGDYAAEHSVKRYLINSYLLKNIYDFSVEGRGIRLRLSFSEFENYKLYSTPLDEATTFIYRINKVYEDKYKQGQAAMNFYDFVQTYNMVYVDTPIDISAEDLEALKRGEEPSELFKRKAVPFRDITNVSKAIGRSDLLTVGSALIGFDIDGNQETIELNKLYEFTMFAMQSMRINGQLHLGGTELAAMQILKIKVQSAIGMPDFRSADPRTYDEEFRKWIYRFISVYNTWKRMLNFASVGWSAGMMPIFMNASGNVLEFDGVDIDTFERLEHALREVYGELELERLFAPLLESAENSRKWDRTRHNTQEWQTNQSGEKSWVSSLIKIRHSYHNWTIEQFALRNRIVVKSEPSSFGYDENGKAKFFFGEDRQYFKRVQGRIKSRNFTPSDILFRLSQQRSADYGRYTKHFKDATASQVHKKGDKHKEDRNIFVEIKEALQDKRFHDYAAGLLEVAYSMAPEMYEYFGMGSPVQFLMSSYGQDLLSAKTTDEYRSKFISMIIRYRLGRAANVQRSLDELDNGVESEDNKTAEEIENRRSKLEARLMLELQDLSDSSMVWATIVDELSTGNIAFGMLKQGKKDKKDKQNPESGPYRSADKFWNMENNQYTSLLDVLQSDLSYDTKVKVLIDVTKLNQHFDGIGENEIMGQLMAHPKQGASINRFSDGGRTITNDISDVKDTVMMLDNVTQVSPENLTKTAAAVIEAAREDPAGFEYMVREFADNPAMMVRLDLDIAADAVASACSPTNDEASKTAHRATVTSYFQAVSQQLNGGYASYFELSDNSVINMISADRITFKDWVNIIGHPDVTWKMSDAYGAGVTLSRESLCGSNSTKDLIDWLERNPRIACCFRHYIVGARRTTTRDGKKRKPGAKVNAWGGSTDTNAVYRVFSLFNNRYRFLSIAAAMESYKGQPVRNMYPKVKKSLEDLCTFVAYNARELRGLSKEEQIRFLMDTLPKRIDSILGISAAKAGEAQMEKYKDFLSMFPDYSLDFGGEYANNMSLLFATEIINEITECVDIAAQSLTRDQLDVGDDAYKDIERRTLDETSIIAYNFSKADLVGAQTNVMIGVEGSITTKNIEIKDYLKRRKDKYKSFTEYDPETMAELDEINRAKYPQGLEKALEDSPDHIIVAIVHTGIENGDETLTRTQSRNFGSIAMKQEKEREDSAESGNAKTRKNGDDMTNAIVKNLRFPSEELLKRYGYSRHDAPNTDKKYWSIEDASSLVEKIERLKVADLEIAIEELAKSLMDADTRLGHIGDNFDPADYYNLADLMIGVNSDDTLVVRSIDQLAAAARSRLSDETIAAIINDEAKFSYDNDPVVKEIEEILDVVGTDRDLMYRGLDQLVTDMSHETTIHSEIKGSHRFDRAMSTDSSSMTRNINKLEEMYRRYWNDAKYLGVKSTERASSNKTMTEKSQKNIRELMNDEPKVQWQVNTEKASWYAIEQELRKHPETLAGKIWRLTNSTNGSYFYIGDTSGNKMPYVPGPLNLMLLNNYADPKNDELAADMCKEYGITALYENYEWIPEKYREDVLEVDEGMYIIPFFDMAVNGSASNPISPEPAEFYLLPDQLTMLLYDGTGTLNLGDSGARYFPSLMGRLHCGWESKPYTYNITEVFPNLCMTTGANSDVRLDVCSYNEVLSNIIGNRETRFDKARSVIVIGDTEIPIDLGYPIGSDMYNRYAEIFMDRLDKYSDRVLGDADDISLIWDDFRFDEIIGFVKFVNRSRTVGYAPLWVSRFGEKGRFPTTARLSNFNMSDSQMTLQFGYFGVPDNAVMKGFAGDFGSMKFVGKLSESEQMYLQSGRAIDIAVDKNSAANKFAGGNLRVDSLITSFLTAKVDPDYSFNYAEFEGFFPGVTEVKLENGTVLDLREAVYDNLLGTADWRYLVRSGQIKKFSSFPDINDLLSRWWFLCDKYNINFNIFLSSRGADPRRPDFPRITEFWPFFGKSIKWQNAYMHYMHLSGTNIMPPSIDYQITESENFLFIPVSPSMMEKNNWYYQNEEAGVLQQIVEYKGVDRNGKTFTYNVPSTVIAYTGFFSDTLNTLVNKPNINASQNTIDTLNVASRPSRKNRHMLLEYGRAGFANINKVNGKYIDLDLSTIFDGQEEASPKTSLDTSAAPQPAPELVVDPAKDGIDHVNIYKSKKSQVAAAMDPAAPVIGTKIVEGEDGAIMTPMRFKEGNFNTIWGYLFFLRYKSTLSKSEKDALKTLSGEDLYRFCAELQQSRDLPRDTISFEDLKAKIDNAVDKKLSLLGNPDSEYPIDFFDKQFDLPMTMYTVRDGKVIMKTGNITNYLIDSINRHVIKTRNRIIRISKKTEKKNIPVAELEPKKQPEAATGEAKTTRGLRGLLSMFGKKGREDVE